MLSKGKQLRNDGILKLRDGADMATDVSTPEPHIRIDIPNSVNDYPRVAIDGENISNGIINRAVQRVLIKYDTGTDISEPKQSVNIKYIERDAGGKWSVKHCDESTMNSDDDEDNVDKEHKPKIHEITNQPLGVYGNRKLTEYWWNTKDSKMIELLSKPNTRLAIIEDDTNA